MNFLDIIIVIPLLYGLIKGFLNGLIKEVTELLALIFGIYVAVNFSSYLHPIFIVFLAEYEQFVPIVSFAVLFVLILLATRLLGYFLDKLTKALALGMISKILGSFFGFLKIGIACGFLLVIATEYKLINNQTQNKSVLLTPLKNITKTIIPKINKHKDTFLNKIEKSTKKAKKEINKRVNLQ